MTPTTTPPHRAQPRINHVTTEGLTDYLSYVSKGFLGEYHDDTAETDAKIHLPDRTFGHQVDGRWVSSTADYARAMALPGGALVDIGAVTIVTVSPSYRRRGLLREMMTHQLNLIHERGDAFSLLWASESLIYGRFGYGSAVPTTHIKGQTRSLAFLPGIDLGDGSVAEVTKEEYLAAAPGIHAALLPERPGALDRQEPWWEATYLDIERDRGGASARRYLLHFDRSGVATGYAAYRTKHVGGEEWPNSEVMISDLDALDRSAYARIWRYLLDLDLVRSFSKMSAVDEPLKYLVADHRAIRTELSDGTYLRLVDVKRALEARAYLVDVDLVLEVTDPVLPHNEGRWHLQAGPDGASVKKARRRPDLSLSIRDLATVFLGGVPLSALAANGLATEHKPGAVTAATLAFSWTRAPFTPDHF